jgi:hypothetical protein
MGVKKKLKKQIKRLAETIPVVMSHCHEDHYVKGSELIEQGHKELPDGGSIDPEKMYKQKMPVVIARNHENRLKRIYQTHGREGVTHYINEIKKIAAAQ